MKRIAYIKMKRIAYIAASLFLIAALGLTSFAEFENDHINTGNHAEDFIAAALSQVGCQDTQKYESSGSESSAAFVVWSARQADIPESIIPSSESAQELYAIFAYAGDIEENSEYTPKCGDILFLGEDGTPNQCAAVVSADEEYITAVTLGDDGEVRKKLYELSYDKILGFALPEYEYISAYVTGKHITTASFLNFREAPTTSSAAYCQIPMGTVVDITEISGEWGRIVYNGSTGWINMQYAAVYDEPQKKPDADITDTDYTVEWNVIDVSKWQGKIDWEKVASANIQGVILRIGLRATKTREISIDDRFFEYYDGAKQTGLHIGCYFYSAAKSVEDVREETQFIISTIENNNLTFDMPVYLDLEERLTSDMGKDAVRAITTEYLNIMNSENIYSGIYCNRSWAQTFYTAEMFNENDLWIAEYADKCNYSGKYGMWQYTGKGSVSGVEEKFTDISICYVNYPKLIEDMGYNLKEDTQSPRDLGDVNGDGKTAAADARIALRAAAGIHTLSDVQRTAADVNGDGKITASDARKILRVAAGIDTFSLPERGTS